MARKEPIVNDARLQEISEEGEVSPRIAVPAQQRAVIVEDETLLDVYQEILQNCRDDRRECDTYLTNFVEMVINEGDSTTASKEALVNLMKIKTDISDKMSKIAGEMTRLKLKEKYDLAPKSIEQQTNHIHIDADRRSLIEMIEDARQKSESKDEELLVREEEKKDE